MQFPPPEVGAYLEAGTSAIALYSQELGSLNEDEMFSSLMKWDEKTMSSAMEEMVTRVTDAKAGLQKKGQNEFSKSCLKIFVAYHLMKRVVNIFELTRLYAGFKKEDLHKIEIEHMKPAGLHNSIIRECIRYIIETSRAEQIDVVQLATSVYAFEALETVILKLWCFKPGLFDEKGARRIFFVPCTALEEELSSIMHTTLKIMVWSYGWLKQIQAKDFHDTAANESKEKKTVKEPSAAKRSRGRPKKNKVAEMKDDGNTQAKESKHSDTENTRIVLINLLHAAGNFMATLLVIDMTTNIKHMNNMIEDENEEMKSHYVESLHNFGKVNDFIFSLCAFDEMPRVWRYERKLNERFMVNKGIKGNWCEQLISKMFTEDMMLFDDIGNRSCFKLAQKLKSMRLKFGTEVKKERWFNSTIDEYLQSQSRKSKRERKKDKSKRKKKSTKSKRKKGERDSVIGNDSDGSAREENEAVSTRNSTYNAGESIVKVTSPANNRKKTKNDEIGADALLDLWEMKPEKPNKGKSKKQNPDNFLDASTNEYSEESIENLAVILKKTEHSIESLNLTNIPSLFRDPGSLGASAGNCVAEIIGTAGVIEGISAMARALEINPFLLTDKDKLSLTAGKTAAVAVTAAVSGIERSIYQNNVKVQYGIPMNNQSVSIGAQQVPITGQQLCMQQLPIPNSVQQHGPAAYETKNKK